VYAGTQWRAKRSVVGNAKNGEEGTESLTLLLALTSLVHGLVNVGTQFQAKRSVARYAKSGEERHTHTVLLRNLKLSVTKLLIIGLVLVETRCPQPSLVVGSVTIGEGGRGKGGGS